mgnify:CR=1 FL=1
MKIKTSIIIPNFNTRKLLEDCITSIMKYTKHYEIIVIDNGSQDDSLEYLNSLKNYENLKVIFNTTNLGFAKANNQGAKLAAGKYLCFMNSDIIVGANWLDELYKTFAKFENCGAVGPLANPDCYLTIQGKQIKYPQYKNQFANDVCVNHLIGFCILMPKLLFEEINGWSEDFELGNFEDTFLSIKIRYLAKKKLAISVKSEVYHLHPSATFRKNNINYQKFYDKNKEIFIKKIKELNIDLTETDKNLLF